LSYQPYRFAGTQIYEKSNIYQYEYLSAITLHGPGYLLAGCRFQLIRRLAIDGSPRSLRYAIKSLSDELSDIWLFAGSGAGDIEHVHLVVFQETCEPLRSVPLTGVKVQARFVVLPGELDSLPGASAQDGIYGEQNRGVAIAHIPFGSLEVGS
jgi:hypothetical protein